MMLCPVAAPTSYEGPFGKIIYRVRAAIDTSRFSKDYKAQRPFYLLNLLNLNEVPDIEVSVQCTNLTDCLFIFFYSFTNMNVAVLFLISKSQRRKDF